MFNFKFLETYIPLGSRNTWKNLKKKKKKKNSFGRKNSGSDTDTNSFGRYFRPIPNFGRTLYLHTIKLMQMYVCPRGGWEVN